MHPKIRLDEQPLDRYTSDYRDKNGAPWRLYPDEDGYRHTPCIVCGRARYGVNGFFMNLDTGDCACNRERCVHVEPYIGS